MSYDLVVANGTTSVVSENDNHTKSKEDTDDDKFVNVWKHSHIIRGEDYERLNPMEYLNDTLIDLWMTW